LEHVGAIALARFGLLHTDPLQLEDLHGDSLHDAHDQRRQS
jgi:hypothetical protein